MIVWWHVCRSFKVFPFTDLSWKTISWKTNLKFSTYLSWYLMISCLAHPHLLPLFHSLGSRRYLVILVTVSIAMLVVSFLAWLTSTTLRKSTRMRMEFPSVTSCEYHYPYLVSLPYGTAGCFSWKHSSFLCYLLGLEGLKRTLDFLLDRFDNDVFPFFLFYP